MLKWDNLFIIIAGMLQGTGIMGVVLICGLLDGPLDWHSKLGGLAPCKLFDDKIMITTIEHLSYWQP